MLEITSTRHNLLIDPVLRAWSWEIPLYLFVGGIVAGMMVIGGLAMLRTAKGDDTRSFFSMQTPLLGFVLMNIGMLALLLDLTHRLYVWRIYTTFQYQSPMAWGSWVLLVVYGVLMVSALIRLPDVWPWLGRTVPVIKTLSDSLVAKTQWITALGWANIVLGVGLGIYTGILLSAMVARPLWNSAILGPLFLFSGLSAAAAMVHIAVRIFPGRPAPQGLVGGAFAAMWQPLGARAPRAGTENALVRADVGFLGVELVLLALLLLGLVTAGASQIAAAQILISGAYAPAFWGAIVFAGIVLPIALQLLELGHRIPHTVVPALLVLAGGFALRWVLVNAGQASQVLQSASR